jgi:hypothetical protein
LVTSCGLKAGRSRYTGRSKKESSLGRGNSRTRQCGCRSAAAILGPTGQTFQVSQGVKKRTFRLSLTAAEQIYNDPPGSLTKDDDSGKRREQIVDRRADLRGQKLARQKIFGHLRARQVCKDSPLEGFSNLRSLSDHVGSLAVKAAAGETERAVSNCFFPLTPDFDTVAAVTVP